MLAIGSIILLTSFVLVDPGITPFQIWDEARLANNVFEIQQNGNLLVTHFMGEPDLWNTKPPLLIWIQLLSVSVFGFTEAAFRLPSLLAIVATAITMLLFLWRYTKRIEIGLFASVILITSTGYMGHHIGRTGDYDAILTLFTTLNGLFFFLAIESQKKKYIYLFFIFLSCAALTKGISSLLFVPALLLYAIIRKKLLYWLRQMDLYRAAMIFIVSVGGYYLAREFASPGYLEKIVENELGGRYLVTQNEHKNGSFYFVFMLKKIRFKEWFFFLPLMFIPIFQQKDSRRKNLALFSLLMTSLFCAVISGSQTKLGWYDAPMYPFMAMGISLGVVTVIDWFFELSSIKNQWLRNFLIASCIGLICFIPYRRSYHRSLKPYYQPQKAFYDMSFLLREAIEGKHDFEAYKVVFDKTGTPSQHIKIYVNLLQKKGIDIQLAFSKNLQKGDRIIVTKDVAQKKIIGKYDVQLIEELGGIDAYLIKGKARIR